MKIFFVFQFGNFEGDFGSFGQDILICLLGAVLGVGGAYVIYIWSLCIYRRDRLRYVVALLESIIPYIEVQASYCGEIAETIKAEPSKLPLLRFAANRDLKRLSDKLDQEGVYHAFLSKYKRIQKTYSEFQHIYGLIDYLDYSIDEITTFTEKVSNSLWERKKEYADTFRSSQNQLKRLLIDPEFRQNFSEFHRDFSGILDDFVRDNPEGEENVKYTFDNLISPIQTYIVDNVPIINVITDLVVTLGSAAEQYRGIELSALKTAEDFEEFQNDLIQSLEKLKNNTSQLRTDYSITNLKENKIRTRISRLLSPK